MSAPFGITKDPTTFGTSLAPRDVLEPKSKPPEPEPKRGLPPAVIGIFAGLATALVWAGLGVWLEHQQTVERKAQSEACQVCTSTADYIACMDSHWPPSAIKRCKGR